MPQRSAGSNNPARPIVELTTNRPVVMAGGTLRFVPAPHLVIDNAGFENPVLADDGWNYSMDDQGWGYYDNDGYQGSWNAVTDNYPDEALSRADMALYEAKALGKNCVASVPMDREAACP